MNKHKLTGFALCFAALTFWMSWYLMPDPGTTDAAHILAIVKENRYMVFTSVVVQIVSSVVYVIALVSLSQLYLPQRKSTFWGLVLLGIGVLGLCSDAFFHLLAFYMTDGSVNIDQDVFTVMTFMQTGGVVFLVPILLPFFIGSVVLSLGLKNQGVISSIPTRMLITALTVGPLCVALSKVVFSYDGNAFTLALLGLVALAQMIIGVQINQAKSV